MQNPHASVGCFYCTFILCNRFALSVNSALCLQHHADVACYFSENKVNHLLLPDKGIHYPFPLPEDAGLVFSNVFAAWLRSKKARECSDVLTRMRLPNSWINSQFMSSVSVEAHQSLRRVGGGTINARAATNSESMDICSTSDSNLTLFTLLLCYIFFPGSADKTSKHAGWALTRCFPNLLCIEKRQ